MRRSVVTKRSRPPKPVAEVATAFASSLRKILDDDLVALYLHGSAAFPQGRSRIKDVDFHVILRRPLTNTTRRKIRSLHLDLADRYPGVGDNLDVYYVTAEDARRRRPPRHQLDLSVRDHSWALHRAHWLAGRYVVVHGPPSQQLCPSPSWSELERGLRHEFSYAARRIHDETAWWYGVLNISRVLCSVRTRNVVVSKEEAARWGLRNLPRQHHHLIRSALRARDREADELDRTALRDEARGFLAYARDRMKAGARTGTDI